VILTSRSGIKGKEDMLSNALSRKVHVHHIAAMSSYGIDLQERNLQAGKYDEMYQNIKHKLQHQSTSDEDVDYHLTEDGLVRFKERIYVPDNNELKNIIFREFHVKLYLGNLE